MSDLLILIPVALAMLGAHLGFMRLHRITNTRKQLGLLLSSFACLAFIIAHLSQWMLVPEPTNAFEISQYWIWWLVHTAMLSAYCIYNGGKKWRTYFHKIPHQLMWWALATSSWFFGKHWRRALDIPANGSSYWVCFWLRQLSRFP